MTEDKLYEMAMQCVKRSAEGCSCECDFCEYNISEYISDAKEAALLKTAAYTDYISRQRVLKKPNKELDISKYSKKTALVVLIVLCIVIGIVALVNNSYEPIDSKTQRKVDKTLSKVAANYKDVNGDGLVNCIDAAVLFYKYYPNKNDVNIELNYNKSTGLNHLFNVVNFNGNWKAIEPQSKINNHHSYFMTDVWGSQYDPAYDKVVTNNYIKYVKK